MLDALEQASCWVSMKVDSVETVRDGTKQRGESVKYERSEEAVVLFLPATGWGSWRAFYRITVPLEQRGNVSVAVSRMLPCRPLVSTRQRNGRHTARRIA